MNTFLNENDDDYTETANFLIAHIELENAKKAARAAFFIAALAAFFAFSSSMWAIRKFAVSV